MAYQVILSQIVLAMLVAMAMVACSPSMYTTRTVSNGSGICTVGPKSRYGNPPSYVVAGRRYYVRASACGYRERGLASWYGPKFHGKRTSSGDVYNMHAMTAAHKTLPLPVDVRVTRLDNGKSLVVRVNDRGPFHKGRVIDLSFAAAKALDIVKTGTAPVELVVIGQPGKATTLPATVYYVQVGAFTDRANAENLLNRLLEQGFVEVQIRKPDHSQGDQLNRVWLGPFTTEAQGQRIRDRLTALGYSEHRIISD